MREVQAVNAVRKAAVLKGMKMADAMSTWQTIDQVPERFVQKLEKTEEKKTVLDTLYEKIVTTTEKVSGKASSRAVELPE